MNDQLPPSVKKYEYAMYASLFFRLPVLFLVVSGIIPVFSLAPWITAAPIAIVFFFVYCIYATSRRKVNWARYVLLLAFIYFVYGLSGFILQPAYFLISIYPAFAACSAICHGIAMYFIFTKESTDWIKSGN